MNRTQHLGLLIGALAISFTLPCQAASLMVYDSQEKFLADTKATATSPFPTIGKTTHYSHDNIRFTPTSPNTLVGRNLTNLLPGNELGINGLENLNIDLPTLINVFGFDFVEPRLMPNVNAQFIDSTFQVTLFKFGAAIGAFQFARPNDVASFVGVTSDLTFNRVEIREMVGGIENEFYGTFYTGNLSNSDLEQKAVEQVPEPLTFCGGVLGFGAMVAARRRRIVKQQ
jgi:hypothetical protein